MRERGGEVFFSENSLYWYTPKLWRVFSSLLDGWAYAYYTWEDEGEEIEPELTDVPVAPADGGRADAAKGGGGGRGDGGREVGAVLRGEGVAPNLDCDKSRKEIAIFFPPLVHRGGSVEPRTQTADSESAGALSCRPASAPGPGRAFLGRVAHAGQVAHAAAAGAVREAESQSNNRDSSVAWSGF